MPDASAGLPAANTVSAASRGSPMLRCHDVHKSYTLAGRSIPALRGASLAIDAPGFYAIMGASGSGKSTLLHLLAALDRPDSGEIWLGDRAIHSLTERQATAFRRREMGIVFQQFNLVSTLSARENVELPGALAGVLGCGLVITSRMAT